MIELFLYYPVVFLSIHGPRSNKALSLRHKCIKGKHSTLIYPTSGEIECETNAEAILYLNIVDVRRAFTISGVRLSSMANVT
jgi:hypothetical protein